MSAMCIALVQIKTLIYCPMKIDVREYFLGVN